MSLLNLGLDNRMSNLIAGYYTAQFLFAVIVPLTLLCLWL